MNSGDKSNLPERVAVALQSVIGPGPAALHEPSFNGQEWTYLKDCLDSTFVSSIGEYVNQFEADLAELTGAKYAIAVVNGTAALHVSLLLSGVTKGDEVLVPALTFIATANAVTYCGASPHFIDSEESTLGLDPFKLREYLAKHTELRAGQCINKVTGRVIRALLPMHTFGHPVLLEETVDLARDYNLVLVEDAAESLGSYYQGQHTGTFGKFGALSFNGNKVVTTGGGGAILTNDSDRAQQAKHITTTARLPHQWEFRHDQVGYNYRMPNINAALGCAQLEQLHSMLARKRKLYQAYRNEFSEIQGMNIFQEPKNCQSNYWLQTILLDSMHSSHRNEILKQSNERGYMARPVWTLVPEQGQYSVCPSMNIDCAKSLANRLINIPSSSNLVE